MDTIPVFGHNLRVTHMNVYSMRLINVKALLEREKLMEKRE